MRFVLKERPIPKARHSFRGRTPYDPQHGLKNSHKWDFINQMRENGFKAYDKRPLGLSLVSTIPPPKKWSKARKEESYGQPWVTNRPDCSNVLKFYEDALNEIAYEDDAHLSQVFVSQEYGEEYKIIIDIEEIGPDMNQEKVLKKSGEISIKDLEIIVKKAYTKGLFQRNIRRVYEKEESDGIYIYFECQPEKDRYPPNKTLC